MLEGNSGNEAAATGLGIGSRIEITGLWINWEDQMNTNTNILSAKICVWIVGPVPQPSGAQLTQEDFEERLVFSWMGEPPVDKGRKCEQHSEAALIKTSWIMKLPCCVFRCLLGGGLHLVRLNNSQLNIS